MHFAPLISAEMFANGSASGKPAGKTGANALFAAHLTTAAQKQSNASPLIKTKSSQDGLMALLVDVPVEGHNIPDEVLASILADNSAEPGSEFVSLQQGMSATPPSVALISGHLSESNEPVALQRSPGEISAAAESAAGLNLVFREASAQTKGTFSGKGNAEVGQQLTDRPAITGAERNAGREGGVPLAILDNTGNEPRLGQTMERRNGLEGRFMDNPGIGTTIQNNSGQTITIRQFSQTEELLSPPAAGNRTAIEANSSPQDTRAHYIHANLPNRGLPGDGDVNNGQQQESTGKQHKESDSPRPVQQQGQSDIRFVSASLPMTEGDSEPLLFSHTPLITPTATTSTQSEFAVLRLPSGLMVPEGTVIEQLITHFSANRRLESGSVSLQLHPRELGALRMEIKVEQENIKAHITVQNPQAQEMIDRHLPRLREALEQQGLFLQQVEVTLAAEDNANGRRFQHNHPQQQAGRFPRGSITPLTPALETETATDHPAGISGNISVHV